VKRQLKEWMFLIRSELLIPTSQSVKAQIPGDLETRLLTIVEASRVFANEPMHRHTTFRIGGPADYLVLPASAAEVVALVKLAREKGVPITILGNGSNVLVLDGGIRGLVLKFGAAMSSIASKGSTIIAGAGALLSEIARFAAEKYLTGFEFAVGIPGSIGGAVYMNAGAYESEMSSVVKAAVGVTPDGTVRRFGRDALEFGYRHSVFQDNGCIICEIEIELMPSDPETIKRKMEEYTALRLLKQPVDLPSAGSTFKRPPGRFAGTLIEQAGLKGLSVGGAKVSEKHAGFIVNVGDATAKDVLALIQEVQRRVFERFGVLLQPEVRVLGEPK